MENQHMRNRIFRNLLLIVTVSVLLACGSNPPSLPKNIILFIGDGMGVAHVTAAKTVKGTLNLEKFRVMGLSATHSANDYVTDSAAGATSLSTGSATNTGVVAFSSSGDSLKTVLEYAEIRGMATGLVVTSSVTDATPAAFAAHDMSRDSLDSIAVDIAHSNVDVLFGGGLENFLPKSDLKSRRKDEMDLLSELRKTHTVVLSRKEFDTLGRPSAAIGFFADGDLPSADEREISLSEMTAKALDILSADSDGFFLMVEGSQIDWYAADNKSDGLIRETIDFDDAVGVGLSFLSRNPNTLVVVTADHETGGYTLLDGSVPEKKIIDPRFSVHGHSGSMVPVFAAGPMSDRFGGIHDNTFIGKTLIGLIRKL